MTDSVRDKYSSAKEADEEKLVMSNGAYAVCEMLEKLINELKINRSKR